MGYVDDNDLQVALSALERGLAKAGFLELSQVHGMGEAKVSQGMAALELGKRLSALPTGEYPVISSPQDVANLLMAEMAVLDQEHLRVLLLNTKNEVLGAHEIYVGNVNSSVIRPAEVLRPAVRENAPSIIVVHNHRSGDPTPSEEDVSVTRDLVPPPQGNGALLVLLPDPGPLEFALRTLLAAAVPVVLLLVLRCSSGPPSPFSGC